MINTLIASENFWIILALTLLFIISVFISSSGNEETKIRLFTAKDKKEIDNEETATILIGISMCVPVFITACFFVTQSLIADQEHARVNIFLHILSHAFVFFMILAISLVCTFVAWLAFIVSTILSYILLSWQESFKAVRKHNKFMFANLALIAAIIFSFFVCFTFLPISNIFIILLASSIPSMYLYGQEIFFIRKNLKTKQ